MLSEAISRMPDVFDSAILLRGQDYFLRGNVLNIRLSDGLLKARVKGSSSHIYDIHMDLKQWPAKPARCTCPSHLNCKHAAACLFALHEKELSNAPAEMKERLDKRVDVWLKHLRIKEEGMQKKHEATHDLVYLVDLLLTGHEHKVSIQLALAKRLKRGGYGKMAVFNTLPESKKQHFQTVDNDIVAQLLFKSGSTGWFDRFVIRNSDLLEAILKTGRAYLAHNHEQPLQLGSAESASCDWVLHGNGMQHLELAFDEAHQQQEPVLLDKAWYFSKSDRLLGYLETPYSIPQLKHMLDAPAIAVEQAPLLENQLLQLPQPFPLPKIYQETKRVELKPTPVLILDVFTDAPVDEFWTSNPIDRMNATFFASIAFDYGTVRITPETDSDDVFWDDGGVLCSASRSLLAEAQYLQDFKKQINTRPMDAWVAREWGCSSVNHYVLEDILELSDLDYLYQEALPALKSRGWTIEYNSPVYQELIHEDDLEWYSDIEERGTDFFAYQLGILVEGQAVSIVPLVADLIRNYSFDDLEQMEDDTPVLLPLANSRALQLKLARIKPLIRLLLQFGLRQVDAEKGLEISKYQFLLIQETERALQATQARWRGAESLREDLRKLMHSKDIPLVDVPKGLKTQLRDYQHYGFSWLQQLRASRFNGVLADDMGLGKTVQTLAHILYEKEQGRLQRPVLIIAPTSLVGNWQAEARKFAPDLNVLVYHGIDRAHEAFDDYDLVISTYGLIQRDKELFLDYEFYYLILDEAQFIKNARTKTTQIIQQLKATHRLCLSGTPLENHLGELWSLFHFLMPGLLGDAKQFRIWFKTPIEKQGDQERHQTLAMRVKPFMLRRAKNEVALELPPKTEMTRMIALEGAQRDLYEAIRMTMEKKVREAIAKQGLGKSHIVLLDALLKLRQVCCDPRLLSLQQAEMAHGASAKLDVLMELLDNLVDEGRRVLVFSQFTSMLALIEERLKEKQYNYLKLTGQTTQRQELVDTFQQGDIPIFLISLKAGGTGLNLTRADTVIHYDPWWNPAVENQATDRTHRIGQVNPVFVYKLITAGTVEEAILTMQDKKRQLVDGILNADSTKTSGLTEADLEQFFMPL